jgi:hypothetical protein
MGQALAVRTDFTAGEACAETNVAKDAIPMAIAVQSFFMALYLSNMRTSDRQTKANGCTSICKIAPLSINPIYVIKKSH